MNAVARVMLIPNPTRQVSINSNIPAFTLAETGDNACVAMAPPRRGDESCCEDNVFSTGCSVAGWIPLGICFRGEWKATTINGGWRRNRPASRRMQERIIMVRRLFLLFLMLYALLCLIRNTASDRAIIWIKCWKSMVSKSTARMDYTLWGRR